MPDLDGFLPTERMPFTIEEPFTGKFHKLSGVYEGEEISCSVLR
tara:strand:+ start:2221 stop:2352 length:132 start_codon:yes stop_codon:yes gene_type:complete